MKSGIYSRCKLLCALIFSLLSILSCSLGKDEQPVTIVCLSFDDAHSSVYEHALPILNRYSLRATNFVNSGLVGNPQVMNWQQIQSLENDYGWETGGHGLDHVNLAELSYEEAEQQILADKSLLIQHGLRPRSFAIPFGISPSSFYPIITQAYSNIRGSQDIPMHMPVDRQNLGYLPFQSGWTASTIKARITRGVANREALIIIGFHRIETPNAGYYDNCPSSELEEICRWLKETELKVMTVSEAVAALR